MTRKPRFSIERPGLQKGERFIKVYVRAPYPQRCLEELGTMFDESVYEPWTDNGERFYEDEMLKICCGCSRMC